MTNFSLPRATRNLCLQIQAVNNLSFWRKAGSLKYIRSFHTATTFQTSNIKAGDANITTRNTPSYDFKRDYAGLAEPKVTLDYDVPTAEEVNRLIKKDCKLPHHISAGSGKPIIKSPRDIRTVLVTGATGTLVPHILKYLTALPQITKIYCLVRDRRGVPGASRLNDAIAKADLTAEVDMTKIAAIDGDIAEEKLGMQTSTWTSLCKEVDAVIHSAAKVDYREYYLDTDSISHTRAINVGGTKNILEFACEDVVKQVFHASSVIAVTQTDSDGTFTENWQRHDDFNNTYRLAYPCSKFVGEVLIQEAVARGVPVKTFRYPVISGHSSNGKFTEERSLMIYRYLFSMKMGMMPSLQLPAIHIPADIAAEVSCQVFFHDQAPSDVYNIFHPKSSTDHKFIDLAKKFGHPISVVPFQEYSHRLKEAAKENRTLAAFVDILTDEKFYSLFNDTPLRGWLDMPRFWESKKVSALLPNVYADLEPMIVYLERDMKYARDKLGLFSKFGL